MSLASETIYFYNQKDPIPKAAKRPKKVLDEQSKNILNKKLNSKYNSDLFENENTTGPKSLATRLAELTMTTSVTSMRSSIINDASRSGAGPSHSHGPSAFTDTRLHAIKFLTEDMIKELESELSFYNETQIQPTLPGTLIYDWHADWSDLTDKLVPKKNPQWQTKAARDSLIKKSSELSNKKDDKRTGSRLDESKDEESRKERRSSTQRRKSSQGKAIRQASKLSSIVESSKDAKEPSSTAPATATSTAGQNRRSSITQKPGTSVSRRMSIRKDSMSPMNTKNRLDISRITHNVSSTSGCLVSYQLSSRAFREKGWTVLKINIEDEIIDNERKILAALSNCLRNIEDVRKHNERFGLTKPTKIRFYGDHRKEQLEKYKNTNVKPKKSLFAMTILRNEIPRPLDTEFMLECISNPNLSALALTSSSSNSLNTARQQTTTNNKQESLAASYNAPRAPPLLNSQTNDGTVCLFYPNGQLAITQANVFGCCVDASAMHHTNSSNSLGNQVTFASNSNNELGSLISGSSGPGLVWQSFKNSFTTIVYDMNLAKKISRNSSSRSLPGRKLNPSNKNEASSEAVKRENSAKDANKKEHKNKENKEAAMDTHMLAMITCTGCCVCYRANGVPKFICTETSGCLCNKSGAVVYQWKWDELSPQDYDKFKNDLFIDLNEYVRLEYKNPSNIKLKFSCNKETMDFDLGCVKENQNKLHDLLNRTISDVPMKSKLGQTKISPNAKASTLVNYTKHQEKAQNRKEQESAKLDKLLEGTVSYKDIPVMKDLLVTQKKIRSILEDWLVFCRNSLGIMEPEMYILPDLPNKHKISRLNENHSDFDKIVLHRHKSKSAENLITLSETVLFETNIKKLTNSLLKKSRVFAEQKRSKSAVIARKTGKLTKQQLDLMEEMKDFRKQYLSGSLAALKTTTINKRVSTASTFKYTKSILSKTTTQGGRTSTDEFMKPSPRLLTSRSLTFNTFESEKRHQNKMFYLNEFLNDVSNRNSGAVSASGPASARLYTNDELSLICPYTLHQRIVFDRHDADCRCRKQTVPNIHDVEFDYLLKFIPTEQLVIVVVTDSLNEPTNIQMIVQEMYSSNNKNRVQPCKESLKDENRYFYYDVRTATDNSDHTEPGLIARHNVAPGMCLIYKNANLIFCDHIFNGYGYSQQDFLKQLEKCKEDANQGKFLPYNFRFNHTIGKHGRRTAWGGQIGGVDSHEAQYSALGSYTSNNTNFRNISSLSSEVNTMQLNSADLETNSVKMKTGSSILMPKLILSNKENELHLPKITKFSLET